MALVAKDMQSTQASGALPDISRMNWWGRLWQPFWALPVAIVLGSIALGVALPEVDRGASRSLPGLFNGGPSGARDLLGSIAGAMISVTGLVFSITIVVLQLASSQFTPRILQGFLANRTTQTTLGVFSASFVYALTVLRAVRGDGADVDVFVPQLAVTVAYLLVLAAVGVFFAFINHITSSIQISNVISRIGDDARQRIERTYNASSDPDEPSPTWTADHGTKKTPLRLPERHGVIIRVDFRQLCRTAQDLQVVVSLQEPIGAFVAAGQPVGVVWTTRDLTEEDLKRIGKAVGLGPQRTTEQDLAFSIRQLVDIAERALSPGINDPTTATQIIDELHGLLRDLAVRPAISPVVADGQGRVRILHQPPTFAGLLNLATEEITHYGKDSLQVPRALSRMLDDLDRVARPGYRDAIEQVRQLVSAACQAGVARSAR